MSFQDICAGNLVLENEDSLSGNFIFDKPPAHRSIENLEVNMSLKQLLKMLFHVGNLRSKSSWQCDKTNLLTSPVTI